MDRHTYYARWMPQLIEHTKRDMNSIKTRGLQCSDLPIQTVKIDFDDGSAVSFRHAFIVTDAAWPNEVAVFTEHCGYHEFSLHQGDTLTVKAGK